jgi:hypothetical protein
MMTSFALITEGITDQAALKSILGGHYRGLPDDDDIDVNPLQPLRDQTDLSRLPPEAFGGWERVLEYCASPTQVREALELNDYLVIQIDTDCGDERNYGVPLTLGGVERPVRDLVEDVKTRIIGLLGGDLYQAYETQILFAICVHSLECWLVPLHETQIGKKRKTHKCADCLQTALSRSNRKFAKDYRTYYDICRDYRDRGVVARNTKFNESFAIFVASLPALGPVSDPPAA